MAQRTGAHGLVALVLIALVVSGCGGNSDAGTTGASRPASTATSSSSRAAHAETAKQEEQTKLPASQAQASQKQPVQQKQNQSKRPAEEPSPQGKHGPRPVLPAGEPEPTRTPKQKADGTVADMVVSTPAVDGSGALSRTYTCDGKNISPPLEWQGVPPSAKELAVFVMNVAPVNGKIFFDWAVAGIPPSSTGMKAGTVPQGAVVGKNSEGKQGYSLCPAGSSGETYVIAVYALEEKTAPKQGFDAARLREEAPKLSKSAGLLSAAYGG